jgi:hypothetical protein
MALVSAVDVAATEAPAADRATNALEASLRPPSISAGWREANQDTLRPSQVDPPPALSSRALRVWPRKTLLAAAIVALAGVIWLVKSSTSSEPDTVAALPTAAPTVEPSRAPTALPPEAVRPPSTAAASATPVTGGHPSGLVESAKSALFGTEDTVSVTVHVSPPTAVVFKQGQRFGAGEVTVDVVRGTKMTLIARHDGYLPRTFVVDGTYNSVNITLIRPSSAGVAVARAKPAQSADTAAADTPASAMTPDPEPSKRLPAQSTTVGSDPLADVDPL